MDDADTITTFSILREFLKNNQEPIDFKNFNDACGYTEDDAVILLEEMVLKNIVKLSGTKIALSHIGYTILTHLQEKISEKDTE